MKLLYVSIASIILLTVCSTLTQILVQPTATKILPTQPEVRIPTPLPDVSISGHVRENGIDVRSGPGIQFESWGEIPGGEEVVIVGRNLESSWVWVFSVSDRQEGWVPVDSLYFEGDISRLSIMVEGNLPPDSLPPPEVSLCANVGSRGGEAVTCKIQRAYCTYKPDVSGSPTFCYDAPYPNNNFTLLIRQADLSNYDGECILVTGFVELNNGKPQIEALDPFLVTPCY